MTYLARGLVAAMLAALAVGCYQPRAADCQLACVAGTQCPSGFTCKGDGYCHRPDDQASCLDAAAIDAPDASAPDATDATDATDGPPPDGGVTTEAIAAGNRHACAVRGGALYCWGDNRSDQAGAFATTSSNRRFTTPHLVGTDRDWTAVAAGMRHTCGIRAGGALYCWGDASSRQNGTTATTGTPTAVVGPSGAITTASAVCAGGAHGCAIVDGGADVVCWGSDDSGQLGDGSGGTITAQAVTVTRPTPGIQWTAVACGGTHTCAIGDGAVYCWGASGSGRLGHTSTTTDAPSQPVPIADATAVTAGDTFTCARQSDATAHCWGSYGSVSNGVPTPIGGAGVTAVSAGLRGLCVATATQTRCLGLGARGELGNGTFEVANTLAAPVTGLGAVTALASGTDFHCALTAGAVRCWGKNSDGQLGIGTTATLFTPTVVPGQWRRVATGRAATCAIAVPSNEVFCWGQNFGHWNIPGPAPDLLETPVLVPGVGAATDVAVGTDHACAVETDGTVRCWGDALYGRVGDGTSAAGVVAPIAPALGGSPLHASRLALGDHASAAFGPSGLTVWGDNQGSRIGTAVPPATIAAPLVIDGGVMWTSLGLGAAFGCGVRNDNALCWGDGSQGQLGTGQAMQPIPAAIVGPAFRALATAAAGDHVCGVGAGTMDGHLLCWGDNSRRQTDPTMAVATVTAPRRVGTLADWIAVAAGGDTSCGIRGASGSLECWGANDDDSFQAGLDRAPGNVLAPTAIASGFVQAALGWGHGCAVTGSPAFELRCWGDSRYGAGGLAAHHDFASPQLVSFP